MAAGVSMDQTVQEARARARAQEPVGKEPQGVARACVIRCARAVGDVPGTPVALVPRAVVAKAAWTVVARTVAARECAVMDSHLAPGYRFLEEAERTVAVIVA